MSDRKEDCLTNLQFADELLMFSASLNKLEEMLCDFKQSTESVGLGMHPNKTKILSNQVKVKKNGVTMDNIKMEVLQKKRRCTVLWTKNNVRGTRDSRNIEQTESGMGIIPHVSTGTHLESLPPMLQITLVQHGDHADNDLRKRNVDIVPDTCKDDQDRTTKDASPYRPNGKTLQNKEQRRSKEKVFENEWQA